MNNIFVIGLTLILSWSIIKITTKKRYNKFNKTLYSQRDLYNILKNMFDSKIDVTKTVDSQSKKYRENRMVRVMIVGNRAYWVKDNIFYVADAEGDYPIPETAQPVDTSQMSKKDVEKMLFILDNLKDGNINDSGSSRDKEFQ